MSSPSDIQLPLQNKKDRLYNAQSHAAIVLQE